MVDPFAANALFEPSSAVLDVFRPPWVGAALLRTVCINEALFVFEEDTVKCLGMLF